MSKPTDGSPWAYIASRGDRLHGVLVANATPEQVRGFYSEFAGCDIVLMLDEKSYCARLDELN